MLRHLLAFLAVASAASAAGSAVPSAPVTGYGGLALNSSFEEALAKVGQAPFGADQVDQCLNAMPLKGCILIWASRLVPFERKNGVPYGLHLSFSRWGRLTSIDLVFWRSAGITRSQCLEMHNRSAEWVARDYGPLYDDLPPGAGTLVGKSELAIDVSTIPRVEGAGARPASRHNYVAIDTMYLGGECRVDVGFVA